MNENKMRIFIGSSSESADAGLLDQIASIVQEKGHMPIKWNRKPSPFRAGKSTFENLDEMLKKESIDASIFICTGDDKTNYRGINLETPRDNVIFEHGFFLGKLGRQKSVIVRSGNVTLPNDIDGITDFDFSPGKEVGGGINLKQWLEELKNETSDSTETPKGATSRPCKYPEIDPELECGRLKIEKELENIKKSSGLIEVFENQSCAVKDYIKNQNNSEIKTTRILCIRGDNFVQEGDDNWSRVIPRNSYDVTILGNPDDEKMIMNRYVAQKLRDDETQEMFKQRYKSAMLHAQNLLKNYKNNKVYLHNESDLPFRMIFIDDFLFLSTYHKNIIASESGVIKIYRNSTLYSVCEEYFSKIKSNLAPIQ